MFIDTNALVYSLIPQAPDHDIAAAVLERAVDNNEPACISRQIICEYLAVVTRPQVWSPPLSMEDALDNVLWMLNTFLLLGDGPAVTNRLMALCREVPIGGRQIHDANIVATMLANGERRLLTFNASDFRRYGNRIELVEG